MEDYCRNTHTPAWCPEVHVCGSYKLNETINRQLTQHIFQYSSFIIKLFDMIFNTVYLGTCIRQSNTTKFDSIQMFIYAKR